MTYRLNYEKHRGGTHSETSSWPQPKDQVIASDMTRAGEGPATHHNRRYWCLGAAAHRTSAFYLCAFEIQPELTLLLLFTSIFIFLRQGLSM